MSTPHDSAAASWADVAPLFTDDGFVELLCAALSLLPQREWALTRRVRQLRGALSLVRSISEFRLPATGPTVAPTSNDAAAEYQKRHGGPAGRPTSARPGSAAPSRGGVSSSGG